MRPMTYTLNEELIDKIRQEAIKKQLTMSDLLRRIIEYYFEKEVKKV
jgi:hypothetical protein